MGEGDQNAPAVSDVANQLAKQDLEGGASETVSAIIDRITTEVINDRKKDAETSLHQSKLAKAGKLGKGPQQKRTGADEGGGQGLGGAPAENNPAPTLLLLRTWRNTWETLTGRPSVESASVDEVVREPRVAPTDSRQPLLPSRDVLPVPGAPRGNGQIHFIRNDNRPNLSLPREQRRAEVDQRLAAHNGTRPTRWDKPPVQAPRRSPPRRDTRRSPERTLDNSRRRQRTPSPVDRRARPDDAKSSGLRRWCP
jgi:hypothetical protein